MSIGKRKRKINGRRVEDGHYTVFFTDHKETRRSLPAFTDGAASAELERNIKRLVSFRGSRLAPDAELIRFLEGCRPDIRDKLAAWNIIDPQRAAAGKSLADHIEDWRNALEAKGNTREHIREAVAKITRISKACGWKQLSDINGSGFDHWRNQAKAKGKSVQTTNHYLTVAKNFCGWLVMNRRLSENPLAFLKKKTVVDSDRRRVRHASEDSELEALLAATVAGKTHHGMTGQERALLYRLAIETGFRWNECRTLIRANFDLENGDSPTVTVTGGNAKNRKARTNPISPALALELKEHMALFFPTARAFPHMSRWRGAGAVMLREDLAAAGIPFKDDSTGEVRDFHSLRKTFGTRLCRNGVFLVDAQRLLDHSTPILTANLYTGVTMEDKAAAIRKLPVLGLSGQKAGVLAKTGTTDDTNDRDGGDDRPFETGRTGNQTRDALGDETGDKKLAGFLARSPKTITTSNINWLQQSENRMDHSMDSSKAGGIACEAAKSAGAGLEESAKKAEIQGNFEQSEGNVGIVGISKNGDFMDYLMDFFSPNLDKFIRTYKIGENEPNQGIFSNGLSGKCLTNIALSKIMSSARRDAGAVDRAGFENQ